MIYRLTFYGLMALLVLGCAGEKQTNQDKFKTQTKTDQNGNKYKTVTNDPYDARVYELDNGLKVYLTKDEEEPRIQTLIAVKAGSASEQKETTGLAHYLEHMLFKGTSELGTTNWEKEKPLLEQISRLYEKRKETDDSAKKARLYRTIDSLSQEAAQYTIPNEYDKIVSSMGGSRTNAFTSKDRTVYMNNIPSNEVEKWIHLERERFGDMVLRLFHTELETVFEEFNQTQDNDFRKARMAMNKALFQGHPYRYSTIGKPEDLKHPSMKNVHAFKDEYYVPNNMAICLSGDLDPAKTFELIKEQWGDMEPNPDLKEDRNHGKADPIDSTIVKSVQGPEAKRVYVGYRFPATDTAKLMVSLVDELLYNGQAGLIDLNLEKQQKILDGGCYSNFYREYGQLQFYGQARDDQSLEAVKDSLMAQVNKLKQGDFPDWMLEAVIQNKKKERIQRRSSNYKAFTFVDAFIKDQPWHEQVNYLEKLADINKSDVVDFANQNLNNNRVIVYKRNGEDTSAVEMPKPPITSVDINRDDRSAFHKAIDTMETKRIEPVFLDYDERIQTSELKKGIELNYIENKENELFRLYYMADIGRQHDRQLSLAIDYLEKIGTDKYSPEELEQEFYKLASSFNVSTSGDRSYLSVSGLRENLEPTIELMEHILANAKADTAAYRKMVDNKIEERKNRKKSKRWNFRALSTYGMYGAQSGFTNKIPSDSLRQIHPEQLVDKVQNLYKHDHYMLYYGTREPGKVKAILSDEHPVPGQLKPIPDKREYTIRKTSGNQVYLADYDMVQAQVAMVARGKQHDTTLFPYARLYNQYYGSGLSSILFQEIRESKGLAYSVYGYFSSPDTGKHHVSRTYVGTQLNKMEDANEAIKELLTDMPKAKQQFQTSKTSILKNIETDRTTGASIFFSYLSDQEAGFSQDRDRYIYNKVKSMTMADIKRFFKQHIKQQNYDMMIMTDLDEMDKATAKQYGKVQRLSREELFGYEVGDEGTKASMPSATKP